MKPDTMLGICIPTYRRPEQLLRCVKSIIASAGDYNLPIHIVDDAADDTNSRVIAQLQGLYPFIDYEKNDANMGIDRNILKSIDRCRCRYAWPIGEDDRLLPDAVKKVLAAIEKAETPDFIYVNYAAVDEDFKILLKRRSLDLAGDGFVGSRTFLQDQAWSIGFIGACVIRKSLWSRVAREPYLDTYFAHVGIIMAYLAKRRLFRIAAPLILNRCGTARVFSWTESAFEVLGGWQRLMDRLVPLYGPEACEKAKRSFEAAHGLNTLRFIAYLRADRLLDAARFDRYVRFSGTKRAAARIICQTPPGVFQLTRWLLFALRRRRRPLESALPGCAHLL